MWDKPYVRTEADSDPDVGKRPGFRHALAKNRMGGCFEFSQDTASGPRLANDEIPMSAKETLRNWWERVIHASFLPEAVGIIEWEGRNTCPAAPDQNELAARWTASGLTFIAVGAPFFESVKVCVQLRGDKRISFRIRTPEERAAADPALQPQDIVDKAYLRSILTTIFRFPFQGVDDFAVLEGPSGVFDGVRVFSGRIRSSYLHTGAGKHEMPNESTLRWYDETGLFITDSEPQYFCTGGEMRRPDGPR
jgi:hypothetical protein